MSSLIPQIFGPPFRSARNGGSCAQELQDLTSELLERAGGRIKAGTETDARDTLAAYFTDFDRRLMQAKSSCTERERAAFAELSRLRHGVAGLLDRYAREQLPQVRKLHAFFGHQQGREVGRDHGGQEDAPTP
ncbi:MAG TPA: hypothetical protein VFZ61_33750 [Polyangiales bacterium]